MIDTAALVSSIDLLDLIGRDTPLRWAAGTRGGEYHGACPFCGGNDRLSVQPQRGQWHCRQCSPDDRWHNAIDYYMRRENAPFLRACEDLARLAPLPISAVPPRGPEPRKAVEVEPPSEAWQKRGRAFSDYAQRQLWSVMGEPARAYLRERRGLTDETIKRWRLGWNPAPVRDAAERWGLKGGKVFLAPGIAIPGEVDGTLWYLKVRRALPGDDLAEYIGAEDIDPKDQPPKYLPPRGVQPNVLFAADAIARKSAALVVEGEFDAMLAHQEAGDLLDVVTAGSAHTLPGPNWVYRLADARRLFVCMDRDDAGSKGAEKWAAVSERVRRVSVPNGKDPTAFHQAGGDLRAWVRSLVSPALTYRSILELAERYPDNDAAHSLERLACKLALAHDAGDDGDLRTHLDAYCADWPDTKPLLAAGEALLHRAKEKAA